MSLDFGGDSDHSMDSAFLDLDNYENLYSPRMVDTIRETK